MELSVRWKVGHCGLKCLFIKCGWWLYKSGMLTVHHAIITHLNSAIITHLNSLSRENLIFVVSKWVRCDGTDLSFDSLLLLSQSREGLQFKWNSSCIIKIQDVTRTEDISFRSDWSYHDSKYKCRSTSVPQRLNVWSDALQGTDNNITRGLTLWLLKHLCFLLILVSIGSTSVRTAAYVLAEPD